MEPTARLLTLQRRGHALASAEAQRAKLSVVPLERSFAEACAAAGHAPLRARQAEVLQINVGKVCNMT